MVKAVQVKDLWWKYDGSQDWNLKGINLEVEKGEFLAIVGPTGAGKSTLCMCLNGLIPHNFMGTMKGTVVVGGMNTLKKRVADLSEKVGLVFEDPESQFIGMSVEEELVFGPENLGVPKEEIKQRMEQALDIVRMKDYLNKAPYELSGGQKQRVAIASALVTCPEIMVLDEPTSQLDPVGKAEVFSVISELKRNRNVTIILVEHLTEEIVKYADRVILLYGGRIELEGQPKDFFKEVDLLKEKGVFPPQVTELGYLLNKSYGVSDGNLPLTIYQAYEEITSTLKKVSSRCQK